MEWREFTSLRAEGLARSSKGGRPTRINKSHLMQEAAEEAKLRAISAPCFVDPGLCWREVGNPYVRSVCRLLRSSLDDEPSGSWDQWTWWSYNDLAGRNGSGLCGDETMLRASPVVASMP
jgi:hypothetical protein